ncbi:MAG: LysM peptidoglycan-binding domain-containing protein [Prevotella sp.]|nr:LysM peptidoglycan-binding domain-containing protein [Prevotella sp.]
MKHLLRYFLLLTVLTFCADTACGQQIFKDLHEVQRKETIFGIARDNGLTVQELINANPEMNAPGYELKKGAVIKIPFPAGQAPKDPSAVTPQPSATATTTSASADVDMRQREIRVGVMLPLHNNNGDGKRMVEYYRGVLMACDSLRANGVSTDVRAWNVAEDSDIRETLQDPNAARCDVIIGPLYDKQVKPLGDFAKARGIRVLIPFSTKTTEVYDNGALFQVYQNGNTLNEAYVYRFYQQFKDCHPILIDCNDSTSTKGGFTSSLRRKLEQEGIIYSITNLRSSEEMFQKNFSTTQPNVVILNTSRSAELNVAFAKLNGLKMNNPNLQISMFGYPEWLQYTRTHLDNFYKFDVYVPSTYYMNPLSARTERLRLKYRWNFHQDMQSYPQKFAATGFDQAYFFIKGLHLYGKSFTGASAMVGYTPVQTPLHFERIGNGGMQNRAILLVHYTREQRIETINF